MWQLYLKLVGQMRQLRSRLLGNLNWPSLFRGAMWTLFAKVVSQIAQLTTFIIAARILSSAEFGLFAYCSAVAILLAIFAEGGWGEFVMKMNEDPEKLDQIASVSIIAGLLAMGVGFSVAAVIGYGFGYMPEALLVALFSCWLLPSSLSVVYDGIVVARGHLRVQAIIKIFAELCGLSVTIAGLLTGWSVIALVAGRLTMQLSLLVAFMVVLRWLPKLRLRKAFLWELLNFSRHIVANRFIIFVRSYSGTLVVGSFLGLTDAGYYRAAERIVAAFSELLGEPARLLGWILLRRALASSANGDGAAREIGAVATTFMIVLMAISTPVYIGLALMSGSIVHIALGDAWAPAAILVSLLALKHVLLIPGYLTEPLLSLAGTIRKAPPAILLSSLVNAALILSLAPFGMVAAACAQCIAAVFSIMISIRLQTRHGRLDWNRVLGDCTYIAVAVAAMAISVLLLGDIANASLFSGLLGDLLKVATGVIIYIGTLALLQKASGHTMPIFALVARPRRA